MDKTEYIIEWRDGEVINKGELTRCDKCKYGSLCILGIIQCKIDNRMHRPDWFCADGKRKESTRMMFNDKYETKSKNIKSPLEYDYCGTPKCRYDIEAWNKRVDNE